MERKLGRVPAMILAFLAALAAYGLRLHQIHTIYDEAGRIVAGAGKGFFTWFTLVMVLIFGVAAWLTRPRKKSAALADRSIGILLLDCAAALAVLLGSAAMLLKPEEPVDRVLAVGGLLTALCWAALAMLRYKGKKPQVAWYLLPLAFLIVKLVLRFRVWSRDPAILDYCYDLFALITATLAVCYEGTFCLDKGRRRLAMFFTLCGLFFGAASLANASGRELCVTGGICLWLTASLWRLLRPGKKRPKEEQKAE